MIILEALELCWISSEVASIDQCAHGVTRLVVNGTPFVQASDGEHTLSAAGLNLLRTLEHEHSASVSVTNGDKLFPCCGNDAFATPKERFETHISGCPFGVDLKVQHAGDQVVLTGEAGQTETISKAEWTRAVLAFTNQVQGFYDDNPPRPPLDEDHEIQGWAAFWREWGTRRQRAAEQVG